MLPFALPALGPVGGAIGSLLSGLDFGRMTTGFVNVRDQVEAQIRAAKTGGPAGGIVSGNTGPFFNPNPTPPAAFNQVMNALRPNNITDNKMTAPQAALFGGTKYPQVTVTNTEPWYKSPWVIGAAVLVLFAGGWLFLKRKKR